MLFHAMMEFCLDLLRSKFWLIGEWSITTGVYYVCKQIYSPYKFKLMRQGAMIR